MSTYNFFPTKESFKKFAGNIRKAVNSIEGKLSATEALDAVAKGFGCHDHHSIMAEYRSFDSLLKPFQSKYLIENTTCNNEYADYPLQVALPVSLETAKLIASAYLSLLRLGNEGEVMLRSLDIEWLEYQHECDKLAEQEYAILDSRPSCDCNTTQASYLDMSRIEVTAHGFIYFSCDVDPVNDQWVMANSSGNFSVGDVTPELSHELTKEEVVAAIEKKGRFTCGPFSVTRGTDGSGFVISNSGIKRELNGFQELTKVLRCLFLERL